MSHQRNDRLIMGCPISAGEIKPSATPLNRVESIVKEGDKAICYPGNKRPALLPTGSSIPRPREEGWEEGPELPTPR